MYIQQVGLKLLQEALSLKKVVILYGPRRVGKTTLLNHFMKDKKKVLFVTGEDVFVQEFLSSSSIDKLKQFIADNEWLIIDEAQFIPHIGANLKLIHDHLPHVRVIATGSSSFELANSLGEPLTGRKYTIKMYPLSQIELNSIETPDKTQSSLESRLLYGSFPEVITNDNLSFKQQYLQELVSSYLFKDILAFEGIKKSKKVIDLLTLLAFQLGKEVSVSELAAQLSLSKNTIEKYLDLLEKVFVLINIRGFSRNLRSEVTKTSRYYFYDNGVRNALINNFNPLNRRDDIGLLWENYLVIERLKKQDYEHIFSKNYFWRTYDQKELDWIEEREGNIFAFEFKWKDFEKNPPKLWQETYPQSQYACINRENYLNFIV